MLARTRANLIVLAAGIGIGGVALGGITYVAAQSNGGSTIQACVNRNTGAVRIVTSSHCGSPLETLVTWNQQGPAGATGPAGRDGSPGRDGRPGRDGETGSTGPAGPSGQPGVAGATGATGLQGATGPGGSGSVGPSGLPGAAGASGVAGASGATGATGLTGSGSAGPTGATGASGTAGASGVAGPTGATGVGGGAFFTSSAATMTLTSILGGTSGSGGILPLSGHMTTAGTAAVADPVLAPLINTAILSLPVQSVPIPVTFTKISGSFVLSTVSAPPGNPIVTLEVRLWRIPYGSTTATPTSLFSTCTPTLTVLNGVGTVSECGPGLGSASFAVGDKGFVVFSMTSAVSPLATVYGSGTIAIAP